MVSRRGPAPKTPGRTRGTPAKTFEGFLFDPGARVWHLGCRSGSSVFDFDSLPGCSPLLLRRIRSVFLRAVRTRPTGAARAMLTRLRVLLGDMAARNPGRLADRIEVGDVSLHVGGLPARSRPLGTALRTALMHWASTGAGGLAPGLEGFLHLMDKPTYATGKAVQTCSASQGSLTREELDELEAALACAYDRGAMNLQNYCIILLMIHLALRPIQISLLKVGDLVAPAASGAPTMLLVSQVKQRGRARHREVLTPYVVGTVLTGLLSKQREQAERWASANGIAAGAAPLLPAETPTCGDRQNAPRLSDLTGHQSACSLSSRAASVLGRLDALSHKGENGHVFPLRLRRTEATLMRAGGASLWEVAAFLGHKSLETASIYVQTTPVLGDRLGEALGGVHDAFAAGLVSRVPAFDSHRRGGAAP